MLMIQKGYDKKLNLKDGTIRDITEASDNLNIRALAKPVTKYYLFAPYFRVLMNVTQHIANFVIQMEFSAKDIAKLVGGEIEGDETVLINDFSKIDQGKTGTLSFLANPKYEEFIYTTKASVVLVNQDFSPSQPLSSTLTLIRVDNAYEKD